MSLSVTAQPQIPFYLFGFDSYGFWALTLDWNLDLYLGLPIILLTLVLDDNLQLI